MEWWVNIIPGRYTCVDEKKLGSMQILFLVSPNPLWNSNNHILYARTHIWRHKTQLLLLLLKKRGQFYLFCNMLPCRAYYKTAVCSPWQRRALNKTGINIKISYVQASHKAHRGSTIGIMLFTARRMGCPCQGNTASTNTASCDQPAFSPPPARAEITVDPLSG